jgi:hypothetical protein
MSSREPAAWPADVRSALAASLARHAGTSLGYGTERLLSATPKAMSTKKLEEPAYLMGQTVEQEREKSGHLSISWSASSCQVLSSLLYWREHGIGARLAARMMDQEGKARKARDAAPRVRRPDESWKETYNDQCLTLRAARPTAAF